MDVSETMFMSNLQRTLVAAKTPQLVENVRDDPKLEVLQVRENKVHCEAIHASIMAFCGLGSWIWMDQRLESEKC